MGTEKKKQEKSLALWATQISSLLAGVGRTGMAEEGGTGISPALRAFAYWSKLTVTAHNVKSTMRLVFLVIFLNSQCYLQARVWGCVVCSLGGSVWRCQHQLQPSSPDL